MHEWLETAAATLEREAGLERGLTLSDAETAALLDLARIAAHDSGDRTNAPLLCYLVGLAVGRAGGSVEALAARLQAPAGDA